MVDSEADLEALKRLADLAKIEPPLIGEGYDDWWHEFTEVRRSVLRSLPAIIAALKRAERVEGALLRLWNLRGHTSACPRGVPPYEAPCLCGFSEVVELVNTPRVALAAAPESSDA